MIFSKIVPTFFFWVFVGIFLIVFPGCEKGKCHSEVRDSYNIYPSIENLDIPLVRFPGESFEDIEYRKCCGGELFILKPGKEGRNLHQECKPENINVYNESGAQLDPLDTCVNGQVKSVVLDEN